MTASAARLRIGIDGHVLGKNVGGVERYLSEVVARVPGLLPQHDFVVFVTAETFRRIGADPRPNVTFARLPVSDPLVQRSLVLPWAVRAHRIDVLQTQRIAPWALGSCRLVLTVHDLTPILYPHDYPGFRNRLVRLLTRSSLKRADLVISPSATVCDAITTRYPGLRAPCLPFNNGVDRRHFGRQDVASRADTLRRHGVTRPFVFVPGAIETRKNLAVVMEALARLEPASRLDLILCGPIRNRAYFNRVLRQASALGLAANVRHLGFLPEPDLVALYGEAALCITASRDEGFNLMPVEALACGTPVICSDIPVHRELFDGAVQFFPTDDADALARLIRRGLETAAPRDGAAVEHCLARLSWDAMAHRMAALFHRFDTPDAIARGSVTRGRSGDAGDADPALTMAGLTTTMSE